MPRGRKKKQDTKKLNVTVMVLILLSILLAVLIYTKEGYLGKSLSPALGGIFGFVKYIIPVGMFCVALYIAKEKNMLTYKKKIAMFFGLLVFIECIMACYQFSEGNINKAQGLNDVLSRAFELGTKNIGGGVIGTFVAFIMLKLLGVTGTVIASIGFSIILFVLLFSLHPAEAIAKYLDRVDERRADISAQRESARKENRSKVIQSELPRESWRERKERRDIERELAKEERIKAIKEERLKAANKEPLEEQITINIKENKKKEEAPLEVPNFKGNIKKAVTPKTEKVAEVKKDDDLFQEKEVEKESNTVQTLNLEHMITDSESDFNYEFPPVTLMQDLGPQDDAMSRKALLATAEKLRKTLYSFGVQATVENVSVGPAITRYELAPAAGVRVSKIANLSDDIALSLEAESIRIEAPIPGKHTVGIEVPNKTKSIVPLRDIIESDQFIDKESKLAFALGKDVAGDIEITDIAKMPHLLIAGSTGSGKSVCINTLITSIIYKAKPSEVKLLMVDPKVVELSVYNGIPHLLIPVVTDPKKASGALQWAVQEMVNRYSLFAHKNVRDLKGYNAVAEKEGENTLPQIVIIIDELADLMMVAAKEVEDAICRLAQMARAAGMHLVIATQRPSVDVITGIIKANIPSRIAFAVSSQVDSRTILDGAGAEKLLGKGDMLFYPQGEAKPTRIQGAFISDKEVENIVKFIKQEGEAVYDERIMNSIEKADEPEKVGKDEDDEDDTDPLLEEAIEMVINNQTASTSFIQRRFKVGYARAGRIIDQMEERGIISGYQGSKPREVLFTKERWQEVNMNPSALEGAEDSEAAQESAEEVSQEG